MCSIATGVGSYDLVCQGIHQLSPRSLSSCVVELFNSCDAKKWENIHTLVELTFTIPLSNGHVEHCFSQLKLTKTNRRTSLGEDCLDHILRIRIEGPPLESWDATTAVRLWQKEKTSRVSAGSRK